MPRPNESRRNPRETGGMDVVSRITTDPRKCGGRPCVRGMRIRVTDVLDLLAAGLSQEAILDEMPDLEAEDVRACIQFARRRVDHPVLAELHRADRQARDRGRRRRVQHPHGRGGPPALPAPPPTR